MMRKRITSLALIPFLAACSGNPPDDLGVRDAALKPCPDRPNCVSSFAATEDGVHAIAPLRPRQGETVQAAWQRLIELVSTQERVAIVAQESGYLRAEATTRLMRFVDDVEFLLDESAGVIHVRSASRLGYRDFGVNRERIEAIRSALAG